MRAAVVGAGVILAVAWLVPLPLPNPLWLVAFAFTGAGILGALGIIAGIWAEKFDQLAAFQNFLVMPLTFLAGVFYSVDSLPPFWQAASHLNPVLLCDRRLPVRVLRKIRRLALDEPRDCERRVLCPIMADSAPAARRLQTEALRPPWPTENPSRN